MADEKPKTFDLDILGSSGLHRSSGYVLEDFHLKLQDQLLRYNQFDEMRRNNPIVGAILLLIETFTAQAEWRWEPADESDAAQEQADFMDSVMNDMTMTWDETLSEMLTVLPFGWAFHEKVYKIRGGDVADPKRRSQFDDGKIGLRRLPLRGQESLHKWEFSPEGDILGMWQNPAPDYEFRFIPMDRAILFRIRPEKNNPEGQSILRNAWRSYQFLKQLEEIEAIGHERDLVGYPVMRVPLEVLSKSASEETKATRRELEKQVQNWRRDEYEGMLFPAKVDGMGNETGWDVELLQSGGSKQNNIGETIRRHESRMAMSVLSEFVMLGFEKVGTFSLASSKTHVFSMAVSALMDNIASQINRNIRTDLMQLNNVPKELWPTFVHGDIEAPPLDEIGSFVVNMAQAGLDLSDEATQRKLREIGGLPTDVDFDDLRKPGEVEQEIEEDIKEDLTEDNDDD